MNIPRVMVSDDINDDKANIVVQHSSHSHSRKSPGCEYWPVHVMPMSSSTIGIATTYYYVDIMTSLKLPQEFVCQGHPEFCLHYLPLIRTTPPFE